MTKGNITGHLIAYAVPLVFWKFISAALPYGRFGGCRTILRKRSIGGGRRGGSDHEYPDFSDCGTVTRRIDFDGQATLEQKITSI